MKRIKTNRKDLTDISYPAEYQIVRIPEQKCFPPRSFQGYEPLAYIRDLITLQKRVVKWLTGSDDPFAISSLVSSYGFLPLNISGLADSRYFGVETEYNTTLINNKVINYNFFGKNVKVTQSTKRTDKVNIEIRQLKCASNLGTSDGITDGNLYFSDDNLSSITTGVLPDLFSIGDVRLNFGDWTDRQEINVINYSTNKLSVETKDFINFSSSGTFFVIALETPNAETTHVVQSEIIYPGCLNPSLSALSGSSQNVILAGSNKYITLGINDWTIDDGDTYKAKIKATFDLNNIFKHSDYPDEVQPNRFKIYITHHNYDVTAFGTFSDWNKWLQQDPEINTYIKKNMFTWTSEDYWYNTGFNLNYNNCTYQILDQQTFKTTNINYIYSGILKLTISDITNLYKYVGSFNNILISTNITDNANAVINIPSTAQFQANTSATVEYTAPIRENIYTNQISANIILKNAYNTIQINKVFDTTQINTLTSNVYNNASCEYFYGTNKNEQFSEEYRVPNTNLNIYQNDLQVIPGKGLYYLSGNQYYARTFELNTNTNMLVFKNLNINNINEFINNIQISSTISATNLKDILDCYFVKNNELYIMFQYNISGQNIIKLNINSNIITQNSRICTTILAKPITTTQLDTKYLKLQIEYLLNK